MRMLRAYAVCSECKWELESRNAMGVAAKHSKKYSHEVHVELTYSQIFGRKDKQSQLSHQGIIRVEG